jgi:hypothetical protein
MQYIGRKVRGKVGREGGIAGRKVQTRAGKEDRREVVRSSRQIVCCFFQSADFCLPTN